MEREEKADSDSPKKVDAKKLLTRVRDRYKLMADADRDNRQKAMDDMKFTFIPGEQWTQQERTLRGNRPCYQFNKIRPTVKRVINEMRRNRPGGKVRAVEDGDKDTAETLEGLIRNIWNVSDADTVVDYACEYQVAGGMGAWRVNTKYSSDTAFEQDIVIEPFKNPFCLYADPAASDPIKRDADDWIVTDKITKKAYERRWPKAEVCEFESDDEFDDDGDWQDGETVRICEYWYKEPVTKTIMLLSNGDTIDEDDFAEIKVGEGEEMPTVLKKRVVQSSTIMMCIASGDAILEGPTEWAGSQFPFIQIYGEWFVIDGKAIWYGLPRHARDPQVAYNYARTAIAETVALTPKAKFWATADQAAGLTTQWADADSKNYPFMLYNADPKASGPPQMMPGAQVPMALIQESQIASDEIKATTGIYDASLGNQSNESSGRAINARQSQAELTTFNFSDNAAKGVQRTWELLIDLVPKIFDTQRSIRILGQDLAEKYVKLNTMEFDAQSGEMKPVNDLSKGRYDVTVTMGPSFTTQRQEASETYMGLVQGSPEIMQIAGDLIFKSMDMPYADQIADRMKAMLPPPIQQMIGQGKQIPPEAQAVMAQAQQAMEQVQQHGQMVQQAAQELEQKGAEITSQEAQLKGQVAELEVKKAQFDADATKQLAQVTMAEARLILKQAQAGATEQSTEVAQDREALSAQVQAAMAQIQSESAAFMNAAQQTLLQLHAQQTPKPRVVRIDRQNGSMVPIYEDQVPQ